MRNEPGYASMSLLDRVLEAHGGRERWAMVESMEVDLGCTGIALPMKGQGEALSRFTAIVDVKRPHVEFAGLGTFDGNTPRPPHMARRQRWTNEDVVHFAGYALWGYVTSPFLFLEDDVSVEELSGSRLRVTFPDRIPSHSRVQTFKYGDDGLLEHLDYTAEVFLGTFGRARNFVLEHEVIEGFVVYTKRRIVPRYMPGPTLIAVNFDDVRISLSDSIF